MTGREALLQAFDRLYDAAAAKLDLDYTPRELAEAREQFATRLAASLEVAETVRMPALPREVIEGMESAIRDLSPAEIAGMIASVPLAQQTQEMLRAIAVRQATQRVLEHLVAQADTRFGGN
jgi:hypothetical protein